MEKPNIIWFMIDSMRNEFLNEFGANVERTFLDEIISKGVAFTNCHTVAPFTIVSMGAKLTGCLPSVTGLNGWLKKDAINTIDKNCITIMDILKYQGYYNTLYTDSPYGVYLPGESFDVYHVQEGYKNFPVESYIEHQGPKFIFLCTDIIHDLCCVNQGKFTKSDYSRAVKITADVLREYYEQIKTDNDLILITSDHGIRCIDDFQGHKYDAETTTGRYLTEKTTRNSFNIIWKNHIPSQKNSLLCRSIDIFPTLFDILGFEYPKLDGISLKPTIEGNTVDIKYTYTITGWSVTHPMSIGAYCIKDEQYKLVEFEELRGFSKRWVSALYDYQNDLEEETDLSKKYVEKVEELKYVRDKMIMNKRNIRDLYKKTCFDFKKYIMVRDNNSSSAKCVNNIIKNVWRKKTRPAFLREYYKSEIKRLFYYYFLHKMLYKY